MRSAGIIKRLNGLKDEIEMSELICHEEQIKFKMLIKLRENQKQDSLIQKREDYIQNVLNIYTKNLVIGHYTLNRRKFNSAGRAAYSTNHMSKRAQ